MGQKQSKDELLYHQSVEGNVDNIKALCREGAGLEWMAKDGKTALIVASMDPGLYLVAKTLIEMGANVNAYQPGRHAGTPLHHAAKRGLDQTVKLLLSHGANAFVRNSDSQTPLDVARAKRHINVVRAIEGHTCYYAGNVREILAPGFIEKLAPHLVTRKCWAVVLPCDPPNSTAPPKLELAIYHTEQDVKPLAVIPLWKSKIKDPKFRKADPILKVFDKSSKTRYKFASSIVGDKQQIRRLHSACKGISQVMPPPIQSSDPAAPISASAQVTNSQPSSSMTDTWWGVATPGASHNDWSTSTNPPPSKASSSVFVGVQGTTVAPTVETTSDALGSHSSTPSAPPLPYDNGPIHYPSMQNEAPKPTEANNNTKASCVICWEAPVEGACIPCGHMAGCMSCLNKIKSAKGDCPVCRAKISQVTRLYAV